MLSVHEVSNFTFFLLPWMVIYCWRGVWRKTEEKKDEYHMENLNFTVFYSHFILPDIVVGYACLLLSVMKNWNVFNFVAIIIFLAWWCWWFVFQIWRISPQCHETREDTLKLGFLHLNGAQCLDGGSKSPSTAIYDSHAMSFSVMFTSPFQFVRFR